MAPLQLRPLAVFFCTSLLTVFFFHQIYRFGFNSQKPILNTPGRKFDNPKTKNAVGKIIGFFHMFASDTSLLNDVIKEQVTSLDSSGILEKVDSIQYAYFGPNHESFRIPSDSYKYEKSSASDVFGTEPSTLTLLHKHCLRNLNDIVFYIHSKGSFHPSPDNTALRQNLMISVIQCLNSSEVLMDGDLCGFKLTPIPYPQLTGTEP